MSPIRIDLDEGLAALLHETNQTVENTAEMRMLDVDDDRIDAVESNRSAERTVPVFLFRERSQRAAARACQAGREARQVLVGTPFSAHTITVSARRSSIESRRSCERTKRRS
jgi:hypothetical protein